VIAGWGERNSTPTGRVALEGNFRKDYTARGVHDVLFTWVLVLQGIGERLSSCSRWESTLFFIKVLKMRLNFFIIKTKLNIAMPEREE